MPGEAERPVRYRPATDGDLDGVVAVFLACWRQSYQGILPAPVVASMTDERARELWSLVSRAGDAGTVLADDGDRTLGITRWAVDASSGVGTVSSLYVHPDAQGAGVGAELLTRAVAGIAAMGATRAALWVFEPNAPALAFYERHGWTRDGATRVEPEFGVIELRLTRRVSEAA